MATTTDSRTTGTTLALTPIETVTVRQHTDEVLEVEVTWGPGGAPPAHLHPDQDERFEVLAGVVDVRIGGVERRFGPGEAFDVPRGTAHQMWNAGAEPARAIWQTRPAGGTAAWFTALDRAQRSGRLGPKGMPGLTGMAVLLRHHRHAFRLAAGPRPLVSAVLAVLAGVGRLRGYRPDGSVR